MELANGLHLGFFFFFHLLLLSYYRFPSFYFSLFYFGFFSYFFLFLLQKFLVFFIIISFISSLCLGNSGLLIFIFLSPIFHFHFGGGCSKLDMILVVARSERNRRQPPRLQKNN